MSKRTCDTCAYPKSIPGDCHIACGKAFNSDANPGASIFQILGSVGRTLLPGPTEKVNFRPTLRGWPGCGAWPSCYDSNIVVDCAGYEGKMQAEMRRGEE